MAKKEECEHRWHQEGDGHTKSWWECSRCGETSWIAPWMFSAQQEGWY